MRVAALILAALSTGIGFVVVNGRWRPAPASMVDARATFVPAKSAPCAASADAVPCVVAASTAALERTFVMAGPERIAAADPITFHPGVTPGRLSSRSEGAGAVSNPVRPDLLAAKETGGSGSLHSGGAGAVSGGAGASNNIPATRTLGSDRVAGVMNRTDHNGLLSSLPSGSSALASSASTLPSTAFGAAPAAAGGPVAAPVVAPVFVEHEATVSDLTKGRVDGSTPINISVKGSGEPMSSTPEPSSMLLIGTGVVGLTAFLKRQRAAAATTRKV